MQPARRAAQAGAPPRPPAAAGAPLWRAAVAFRLLTYLYALAVHLAVVGSYRSGNGAWLLFALVTVWTGVAAVATTRRWGRRRAFASADTAITVALMAATPLVATAGWEGRQQVLTTTLWTVNPVVTWAVLAGPLAGAAAATVVAVAGGLVKGNLTLDLERDATLPVLVSVGVVVGLAARALRRSSEQLRLATQVAAATAERERLAREVHDGVLQVLAYVSRRGRQLGGPALELAELAAQQEVALRELLSTDDTAPRAAAETDLRPLLRAALLPGAATGAVTVAAPPDPVPLEHHTAAELTAAVAAALSNTALHAPGAKTYILVEDLGGEVVVSVRDDGPGIPPGRLEQAAREGRMGVSHSIVGRVAALGGTATVEAGEGLGTEWELRVPRRPAQ